MLWVIQFLLEITDFMNILHLLILFSANACMASVLLKESNDLSVVCVCVCARSMHTDTGAPSYYFVIDSTVIREEKNRQDCRLAENTPWEASMNSLMQTI